MPDRILLVCPDPANLTALTGALAGQFRVLSSATAASALHLVDRHGPCVAAVCQVFDDPVSGVAFAASLSQACPGIAIIALTRPPCPDALLGAAMDGLLKGICLLPLTAEALCDKVRQILARCGRRASGHDVAYCQILTRAERDFLLGRGPFASCPAAS